MSRRRKSHRPRHAQRAPQRSVLYVVPAAVGIVDAVAEVNADRRELAHAKRAVERGLMGAGMRKAEAVRTVSAMLPAAILAEAARLRASTAA